MNFQNTLLLKMFAMCAVLIVLGFVMYILVSPSVGNVVIVSGIVVGIVAFLLGYLSHPQ